MSLLSIDTDDAISFVVRSIAFSSVLLNVHVYVKFCYNRIEYDANELWVYVEMTYLRVGVNVTRNVYHLLDCCFYDSGLCCASWWIFRVEKLIKNTDFAERFCLVLLFRTFYMWLK